MLQLLKNLPSFLTYNKIGRKKTSVCSVVWQSNQLVGNVYRKVLLLVCVLLKCALKIDTLLLCWGRKCNLFFFFFFLKLELQKCLLVLRLQEKDIHTTLCSRKGFVVFNILVFYLPSKSNITWKHISESLKKTLGNYASFIHSLINTI